VVWSRLLWVAPLVALLLVIALLVDVGVPMPGTAPRHHSGVPRPVSTHVAASVGPHPSGPPGNWTLTFTDTFGGTALNGSKWYPTCPWSADAYLCSAGDGSLNCFDPGQVSQGNGVLALSESRRTQTCEGRTDAYSGAWIDTSHLGSATGFGFTYGYMEARIKMPDSSGGPGYWPAFWSAPVNGGWPPEFFAV